MVTEVNRLVGDVLAAGFPLALPGVGTLRPERRPARRISKKQLLPPARAIDFSSAVQGTTLASRLAEAARCTQEQAEEIYGRWLGYTLQEGVLTIEGVGTLRMKHFTLDPAFDLRINPQGHAPVTVRRRRRFDWALALGVLAIAAGAALGGYGYLLWQQQKGALPDGIAALLPTKEVRPVPVETTGAADPAAANEAPTTADDRQTPGAEEIAATQAARPDGSAHSAAEGRTTAASADGAARHATTAGTPDSRTTAAAAERSASDTRTEATAVSAPPEGVMTMTPGRCYVVLGVFSTVENAERAVNETARKEGSLRCGIYRFGGKWMVSPFESDDAEACNLFRRAHADRYPDTWVYRAR